MRKRKVYWLQISRSLIALVIMGFGALGLFLSLQVQPVVAVSGGRIGFFLGMLLDMLDFAHLGI